MSSSARSGRRRPKNRNDQVALSASCTKNSASAAVTFAVGRCRQTSQAAVAISTYSVDHTGPNTQAGGVPAGFTNVGYQDLTEAAVNHDPRAAARKQIAMNAPNPI